MMKLDVKEHRYYVSAAALFCFIFLMLVTPTIPQSQEYHKFADKRNLFGVPNTLNVISIFPFLVIGVIGFVLCLHGNYFGISLRGEVWGWIFFYAAVVATAFGSAHYHLKPDDARLVWDRLPVTVALTSVMVIFIIERIDERTGTAFLFPILMLSTVSIAYWRFFDDLRPYAFVQFIPFIAIPAMTVLLPPKYTHSIYWLWSAGFYLLSEIEEAADRKLYKWTHYIISGHTLKHMSAAMVPILLTLMLSRRSIKIERDS
ncbi:hypothetical protein SUGI_0021180 [Cryptomeria japonica]|uniref:uncharacterized protein LOC131029006 isoform X2 n=1 Tax=Cryptomeria japonica TaxID=3369 RepID=UPI002408B834|nr:uncharacterized protein LOC131029006 isoform X2 [Cryptomeria japonica]GLJ05613.1 hypothetical protein SUGI_0021180 [Cryptomeria japonica]